jgi:hypothetical protein
MRASVVDEHGVRHRRPVIEQPTAALQGRSDQVDVCQEADPRDVGHGAGRLTRWLTGRDSCR